MAYRIRDPLSNRGIKLSLAITSAKCGPISLFFIERGAGNNMERTGGKEAGFGISGVYRSGVCLVGRPPTSKAVFLV